MKTKIIEIDELSFTVAKLTLDDIRAADTDLKTLQKRLEDAREKLEESKGELGTVVSEAALEVAHELALDVGRAIEEVRVVQRRAVEIALARGKATAPAEVGKLDIDGLVALYGEVMAYSGMVSREKPREKDAAADGEGPREGEAASP